jgi:PEP-CTERM motif
MTLRGCSIFLMLLLAAGLVQASILPPTGSPPVAPDVFTTPANGPFLADTGNQQFIAKNSMGQMTMVGIYRSTVYSDPNNVFCAGCLDFFFEVTSAAASTDAVARITDASFGAFLTDVGYTTGPGSISGGVTPNTVDRSSNGNVIGFNFNLPAGLAPGKSSQILEVQTNARTFMTGTLQIIDSSVASVTSFQPCPVPEPATATFMLLGMLLVGAGSFARRRI